MELALEVRVCGYSNDAATVALLVSLSAAAAAAVTSARRCEMCLPASQPKSGRQMTTKKES